MQMAIFDLFWHHLFFPRHSFSSELGQCGASWKILCYCLPVVSKLCTNLLLPFFSPIPPNPLITHLISTCLRRMCAGSKIMGTVGCPFTALNGREKKVRKRCVSFPGRKKPRKKTKTCLVLVQLPQAWPAMQICRLQKSPICSPALADITHICSWDNNDVRGTR